METMQRAAAVQAAPFPTYTFREGEGERERGGELDTTDACGSRRMQRQLAWVRRRVDVGRTASGASSQAAVHCVVVQTVCLLEPLFLPHDLLEIDLAPHAVSPVGGCQGL